MAISFNSIVHSCYSSYHRITSCDHLDVEGYISMREDIPPLSHFSPFKKFMKIPLEGDIIEIPCIYKYIAVNALSKNIRRVETSKIQNVIVPLTYFDITTAEVKSSPSAIKAFFHDYPTSDRLLKKKVAGIWYIGGEGIILDENLVPLMMFTLKLEKVQSDKYRPIQQILRINPEVYNREDIISKYLRSKFISNILKVKNEARYLRTLRNPYSVLPDNTYLDWNISVIVEDFSQFFITPTIPDSTFSDEKANLLLKDNLDGILSEIYEVY